MWHHKPCSCNEGQRSANDDSSPYSSKFPQQVNNSKPTPSFHLRNLDENVCKKITSTFTSYLGISNVHVIYTHFTHITVSRTVTDIRRIEYWQYRYAFSQRSNVTKKIWPHLQVWIQFGWRKTFWGPDGRLRTSNWYVLTRKNIYSRLPQCKLASSICKYCSQQICPPGYKHG